MTEAAIVAAWETEEAPALPGIALADLHTLAAGRVLASAGITAAEVDGLACGTASPVALAQQLGIRPRWVEGTSALSGCGTLVQLRRSADAIAAGRAETVLIVHAETTRSQVGVQWRWAPTDPASLIGQFEAPFGAGPQGMFAMYLARYLREYGVDERDLAAVPVAQRAWAAQRPGAAYRTPITEDDVLASPVIAWPLHRLECAATTDNAGAVLVTSARRAAQLAPRPVHLAGGGEGYDSELVSQASDPLAPRPLREAARGALAEAGLAPGELRHLMLYDGFAHGVLFGLDAVGVGEPGRGGRLVRAENRPGGRWPINTNGGYLSYRHGDMAQLVESVRHVRASGGPSLVLGAGPVFSSAAAVILT